MDFTWSYLLLADNYWGASPIPEISDPVYPVNVASIRKILNQFNRTVAKQSSIIDLLYKNFQGVQLNSSRFPVFPEVVECRHPEYTHAVSETHNVTGTEGQKLIMEHLDASLLRYQTN